MKNIQKKFKQAILFLEEYDLHLVRYVFLFLAILCIRLCLEFFANQKLFTLHDAIHIALWFVFIVLAFVIQLHIFSKVDLRKVLKLSIPCFSIALTAPIIDLINSHGKFSKMNYLSIQSFSDFIFSYFTIGGANLTRGATIGIRIEIIILLIASFNYIYVKRKSLIIAFIGMLTIYTVLFLSGTVPMIIHWSTHYFNLAYAVDDHSTELFLYFIDLLLILYILRKVLGAKTTISLDFNTIIDSCLCLAAFVFGIYRARIDYPNNWALDATTMYYFPLLLIILLLTFRHIYLKNQLIFRNGTTDRYENTFLVLIGCTSLIISFYTFFATLLIWSTLFILYEKPTVFVKSSWLSTILRSILYTCFLFLGFMTFGAPLIGINFVDLITILFTFILFGFVTTLIKR